MGNPFIICSQSLTLQTEKVLFAPAKHVFLTPGKRTFNWKYRNICVLCVELSIPCVPARPIKIRPDTRQSRLLQDDSSCILFTSWACDQLKQQALAERARLSAEGILVCVWNAFLLMANYSLKNDEKAACCCRHRRRETSYITSVWFTIVWSCFTYLDVIPMLKCLRVLSVRGVNHSVRDSNTPLLVLQPPTKPLWQLWICPLLEIVICRLVNTA